MGPRALHGGLGWGLICCADWGLIGGCTGWGSKTVMAMDSSSFGGGETAYNHSVSMPVSNLMPVSHLLPLAPHSHLISPTPLLPHPLAPMISPRSLDRQYSFIQVCEWFAARTDLILLLFDPFKLVGYSCLVQGRVGSCSGSCWVTPVWFRVGLGAVQGCLALGMPFTACLANPVVLVGACNSAPPAFLMCHEPAGPQLAPPLPLSQPTL